LSCYSYGNEGAAAVVPVPVIFETDMGNDIDDAMALDLLYKAMDDGKIKLLGISSHKQSRHTTEFIDIMNTWYGYPSIAIAHAAKAAPNGGMADYTETVCNMKRSDGSPLFDRSKTAADIEEPAAMYRRLLAAQPDRSVVIVSVGFCTTVAALLDSPADSISSLIGRELVRQKVKFISVMGGSFGKDKCSEYNILSDIAAAQKFFAEWTSPIVLSPVEAGFMVEYPAESIERDFAWAPAHPLVAGYKAYKKMPYNSPTWDLTSALYAIDPATDMFTRTEPGTLSVDNAGFTNFIPAPQGRHIWLHVDKDQAVRIKEYFIATLTSKPKKR
jgi:inosine-uridine nucleoside N-ribohydrolase